MPGTPGRGQRGSPNAPRPVPEGYDSWPDYYKANPGAVGTGVSTPTGTPGTPASTFENKAENDPLLERQAGRVEDRLDNWDDNTQQSIDMAVSDIRDQTEGRRQAMQGMLAARGIGGTGFEGAYDRSLLGDESRAAARATSGMRIERDRDYDQFLLGSTGALGAVGDANRADRGLALSAWTEANANRRADESLEMQKLQMQLDLVNSLLSGGGAAALAPTQNFSLAPASGFGGKGGRM